MSLERRSFLKGTAACAAYWMLRPPLLSAPAAPGPEVNAFLDDLAERSFRFFWERSDPQTGLTYDRAPSDGGIPEERRRNVGSIAATGFGLAGICVAAERSWIKPDEARTRVRNTLSFFAEHAPQERGWFYHFLDLKSGQRIGSTQTATRKSELSSIDTALLMAGVLTVRHYFRSDPEIVRLATTLYERVDFQWMLNGEPLVLSHGWMPETGFLKARWAKYSEAGIIYFLGIGSPTHPISPDSWYAWERNEQAYADYRFIGSAPLFTHQYSHAFIDFRHRRENRGSRVDWFENAITATKAHRQFCIDQATTFPGYSPTLWGITSSVSANGYKAWGGWPSRAKIDGTVVPCAAGGSLMLAPELCTEALWEMKQRFGGAIYGRHGFADAFHPTNGWVCPEVLGIDAGITLLSAENNRTGNLWRWFMGNPEARRAMELIGLEPGGSRPG